MDIFCSEGVCGFVFVPDAARLFPAVLWTGQTTVRTCVLNVHLGLTSGATARALEAFPLADLTGTRAGMQQVLAGPASRYQAATFANEGLITLHC